MFKKRKDLSDPHEIKTLEEEMVLNSLNVLFKRGIKGTYLYAHDPLLQLKLVTVNQRLVHLLLLGFQVSSLIQLKMVQLFLSCKSMALRFLTQLSFLE